MKLGSSILVVALAFGAFAQNRTNKEIEQVTPAKLKKLQANYKSAKAAYGKKPKDAKVKKAYVEATFALGMGTMYGENLSPHERYAGALGYFREVLKVEPKHKLAKDNYDMIAEIYRRMGRPVPGEKQH